MPVWVVIFTLSIFITFVVIGYITASRKNHHDI